MLIKTRKQNMIRKIYGEHFLDSLGSWEKTGSMLTIRDIVHDKGWFVFCRPVKVQLALQKAHKFITFTNCELN